MNKIYIIAQKEFKDILRSRILLFTILLFVFLVILSISISSLVFYDQVTQFDQSAQLLKSLWKIQNLTKPELYPLSLLRGVVNYIEIVGAILGIFLGYMSVYREKVSRSLSLLLSRPVRNEDIIYGKLLGNFWFILILLTAIGWLILILLSLIAGASIGGMEFLKIGIFIVSSSFYILIFFLLAFFLCIYQRNIINALISSFLIWLIFALILPQIGDTMDTDNQVSWWFFKSMGLARSDEFKVMDHFKTYENIRTSTEQLSITKHYERFEFALFGVKKDFEGKALIYVFREKAFDIFILVLFLFMLIQLNTRYITKNLSIT